MRMKKLLTFLTLLTLFFTTAGAETVIYVPTSSTSGTLTGAPSGVTVTTNNGTYTDGKGLGNTNVTLTMSGFTSSVTVTGVSIDVMTNNNSTQSHTITVKVGTTVIGTSTFGRTSSTTEPDVETVTVTPTSVSDDLSINIKRTTSGGSFYVSKLTVTYTEGGTPATTYSVNLNQSTGGTISASPTTAAEGATVTLTATPDAGYELSTVTVTPTETGVEAPTATVTGNTATFTMPASNVEVEATFTALTTYGITVTGGTASPSTAYQGQTVTVTPTIPDGKVIDQITTTPELTLTPSGDNYTFTMPNEAVTVTITYKDAPTYTNVFERITSTDKLETGVRYLLVYETKPAVMGAISTTSTKYGTSVTSGFTLSNGVITLSGTDAKPLILGGDATNGWTFDLDGNLLSQNKSSGTLNTTNSDNTLWNISFSGNNVVIGHSIDGTDYSIQYNSSSPRFASYSSSQSPIQLYKEMAAIEEVEDLHIVGQVNGNDENPIDTNEGIQLTYSQTSKTYSGDFYCTGVNNGNDSGYSFLLFSKKVPYSFSTTSDLYGAGGNGNAWTINESDLGTAIPLYATSTDNFRLSAGLYTVTVALTGAGFQYTDASVTFTRRDVTMTISPSSGYFSETQTVTMASNLTEIGGKIYYTTNGNDPRDPNSGRIEYTEGVSISATTTFKAVAYVGNLYSDVVEKTYTKTPAAPEITPASCTFNEPLTVTITAEEGATIYYTTDGSTPTDQSTEYTGPFTVSGATTTVKAKAYVNGVYGATATATYTYSNVQPSTGDFVLVTSSNKLIAGNEYIILNSAGTYALGELTNAGSTSNLKGIGTDDFTLNNTTVTAGNNVTIFTLEEATNGWKLKISDNSYLTAPSGTNLSSGSNGATFAISIDDNVATISSTSGRLIKFNTYEGSGNYSGTTFNVFGNYSTSSSGDGYQSVYLYTRETAAVTKPVINPASKVFTEEFDATITCSTQGATIYYTTDGSDPTTSSAVYSSPIHVDKTMTIKAIAAKDGETSAIATAEYQCTMVENIAEYLALPIGTDDIVFKNPVIVQYHYISSSGKSYIYVKDDSGCAYFHQPYETEGTPSMTQLENGDVIGARFYGDKDYDEAVTGVSQYAMFTNLQNFAATGNKALAEPELKTVSDIIATNAAELNNHYITIKKVKLSDLYQALSYGGAKYFDIYDETGTIGQDHIGYNKFNIDYASVVDDTDAFYNITGIFTAYNNLLEFHPTEIYKWAEKEVTLADLCENGEEGESYKITNNLQGVVAVGNSLWVKDENGQSICKTSPASGDEYFEIELEENTRPVQGDYDQSNWLEVVFPDATTAKSFENSIIEGYSIEGVFNSKTNPKLTLASTAQVTKYGNSDVYAPNYYIAPNFTGSQDCATNEHGHFFFMNPKPQEYAQIVWAIWERTGDGNIGHMVITNNPTQNSHQFTGQFYIDLDLNTEEGYKDKTMIPEGGTFNFTAIIRKVESGSSNAPALKAIDNDQSASYMVYPLDLSENSIPTGINTVDVTGKAVKSVKYVNVAGMVSDVPFQGVNIVVTEYSDGSCSTSKMLRK